MTGFFKRLMGKGAPDPTPERPVAASAPPAMPGGRKEEQAPSFVCREPLLDRKEGIAGYQFGMPEEVESRLQNELEFLPKIYDDAVLRNLGSLGDEALLGPRLALVRLAPDSLDNPRILELPSTNTVLMLAPVHKAPVADTPPQRSPVRASCAPANDNRLSVTGRRDRSTAMVSWSLMGMR